MASAEVWCQVTVCGPDGSALGPGRSADRATPGLDVVDLLARLHLASVETRRQRGADRGRREPLGELLDLAGLSRLRGKVGGQAEGGEQPIGFEECVEPADPAA